MYGTDGGASVTNGSGLFYGSAAGANGKNTSTVAVCTNGTNGGAGANGGAHRAVGANGTMVSRGHRAATGQSGEAAAAAAAATNGSGGGFHYRNGDGRGINGLLNGHCGNEDEDENSSSHDKGKIFS
jgi:hypothetical protein